MFIFTRIIFVCVITFFVIFYNSLLLLSLIKILALSRINNLLWFLTRIISGIQFFFFFFYLLLTIFRCSLNIFFSFKNNF